MKHFFVAASALVLMSGSSMAGTPSHLSSDTLRAVQLKGVDIVSTRATGTTPVAFTNVTRAQIARKNIGVDIPFLLNMTPSLTTTSDAGMGVGYTTLRIRGIDASRINITTNGIPMNDAEEQGYYWVDAPDLASSLGSIQVQRGAGTSTNGAAAFGATVNMKTDAQPEESHTEINTSYGSYNTEKETVALGTGLIGNHFILDSRLSNIKTDGYLQRATAKLNSYMVQGGYYNGENFLKLIIFGGKERTYHAWNYDWKPGVNRRYNSCGYMYSDENGTEHYYPNQIDYYLQTNYQLLFHHRFNDHWNLNAALHDTYGYGYYEEYKRSQDLAAYRLADFGSKSDLVRQKKMKNTFAGGVFSLDYHLRKFDASLGGGLNRYYGHHYGVVTWLKDVNGATGSKQWPAGLTPEWQYYRNRGLKVDGNIYLKGSYRLTDGLSLYADMQYRHIHHSIVGPSDNYNHTTGEMQRLDIHKNFDFFNPKAGVNWQINSAHRVYASFSIAQREPTRNCYTNSVDLSGHPLPQLDPRREKFLDYELGYNFHQGIWQAGANLYYMDYTDQLVQNGQLNDIGEAVYINVPSSYREGIELQAAVKPLSWFDWEINATLSRNRIQHYTQSDAVYDADGNVVGNVDTYYKSTTIAFSPSFILNNGFNFHYRGLEAQLQTHYVSRQYLTNTHERALSIDPYLVSDLNVSYTLHPRHFKSVTIGCTIYNLFDEEYESNGWGSRAYYQGAKGNEYGPDYGLSAQAGFHVMGHLTISF